MTQENTENAEEIRMNKLIENYAKAQRRARSATDELNRIHERQETKANHLKIVLGGIVMAVYFADPDQGDKIVYSLAKEVEKYNIKIPENYWDKLQYYLEEERALRDLRTKAKEEEEEAKRAKRAKK